MQGVGGEGVVEGVASEVVGGFEYGGGDDAFGADGAGWEEGAQHF
ncbi:hypothetical protein GCM10027294_49050 [Marinactinospora endophytica]